LNRNNIETALEALQTDVAAIPDSKIRTTVSGLLNLVEMLYGENETLRDENQQLKDEINRLKGEKGKPDIKGKGKKETSDHPITRPKRNVKRAMKITTTRTKRNVDVRPNCSR